MQDIAPTYYDPENMDQPDIKRALVRAAEKKRRKAAMRTDK